MKKGGHDVPIKDINRRFRRTHVNFWELYRPLADQWEIFVNIKGHKLTAFGKSIDTNVVDELLWECFLKT